MIEWRDMMPNSSVYYVIVYKLSTYTDLMYVVPSNELTDLANHAARRPTRRVASTRRNTCEFGASVAPPGDLDVR